MATYRVVKEGKGSYAVRHKFTNVCKGRRATHAEAQGLATRLNSRQERTTERRAFTAGAAVLRDGVAVEVVEQEA